MFKISENVRVLPHPDYGPHYQPYIGQVGVIVDTRTIGQSTRYKVKFSDGKHLWYFEQELDRLDNAQKARHIEDLLSQYDDGDYFGIKTSLVKAGLALLIGDENV